LHVSSEGTFRQTYRLYQPQGEGFVLKILIYKSRFDNYVKQQLYIIPFEALIMERLTASPRITDIYGFCGTTSILEQLPHEVNEIVQAGSGRANQTLLDRLDNVYPQNDLTPYEKVVVARDMAESLADLHGFTDGVIVHGDNHIDQFLADSNGLLKLGDFNLATILEWNDKKGEYCKREREPWRFRVSVTANQLRQITALVNYS
jgi:serine/threonine protein kinase